MYSAKNKLILILIIIFLFTIIYVNFANAQEKLANPVKKQFSFGEYWSLTGQNNKDFRFDTIGLSLDNLDKAILKDGIVVNDSIFVKIGGKCNDSSFQKLVKSARLKRIDLQKVELTEVFLGEGKQSPKINFNFVKVSGSTWAFSETSLKNLEVVQSEFNGRVEFSGGSFHTCYFVMSKFKGEVHFIENLFYEATSFANSEFKEDVRFSGSEFNGKAGFVNAKFFKDVRFSGSEFNGKAGFVNAKFFENVSFYGSHFHDNVDFYRTQFIQKPNFDRAVFSDTLDFRSTNFENGVDFRLSNFDSVKAIYVDNMNFPIGKLYYDLEQFKGKISLDAMEEFDSLKTNERRIVYKEYERFYHLLRDNFLDQDNKDYADAVMYELAKKKESILNEPLHKLYGFFFGYGYKPWRFLLTIILLIFIFAIFWFFFYYSTIAQMIDDKIHEKFEFPKGKREIYPLRSLKFNFRKHQIRPFTKFKISISDHQKISVPYLARIWHVILFSSSVLLKIPFNRKWIHLKNTKFLFWVTFEWLLGIALYIMFVILVKNSKFMFIKDLLGF